MLSIISINWFYRWCSIFSSSTWFRLSVVWFVSCELIWLLGDSKSSAKWSDAELVFIDADFALTKFVPNRSCSFVLNVEALLKLNTLYLSNTLNYDNILRLFRISFDKIQFIKYCKISTFD